MTTTVEQAGPRGAFASRKVFILAAIGSAVGDLEGPYGGYPSWMLNVLGWGRAAAVILVGVLPSLTRWRSATPLEEPYAQTEVVR